MGATTSDEYRRYIEKDTALERRFQAVFVEEPSVEETVEILKVLRPRYEAHHKVTVPCVGRCSGSWRTRYQKVYCPRNSSQNTTL